MEQLPPPIRRLNESAISLIAAGEVLERPAGAVKELIENAMDAGARRITVILEEGGLRAIIVEDDGRGIPPEELPLAVERHATSKLILTDDIPDLLNLDYLGFRGEALASLGAVSDLTISSKVKGAETAFALTVSAGKLGEVVPTSAPQGTRIEARNLFYNTPARLKFLKTARSEFLAVADTVKRLAMSAPDIGFTLIDGSRTALSYPPGTGDLFDMRLRRLAEIVGADFVENAVSVEKERDGIRIEGMTSLPTFHRANGMSQYLFVNNRSVRDKTFSGALRAAYQEFTAKDRFPVTVLFLTLPGEAVDVNAHPTKAEVRFRDAGGVRGFIISAVRDAISGVGHRVSGHVAQATLKTLAKETVPAPQVEAALAAPSSPPPQAFLRAQPSAPRFSFSSFEKKAYPPITPVSPPSAPQTVLANPEPVKPAPPPVQPEEADNRDIPPLGYAVGQVHETYIVAQTADSMVIVDQHAAHERIMLEKVRDGLKKGGLARQALLIPEIIDVGEAGVALFAEKATFLLSLGLLIEPFGLKEVLVRELPAFLNKENIKKLILDLADSLADDSAGVNAVEEKINHICATFACHHSVRAGRKLSVPEMNALLRQMETTPHSGQCNHGRPVYVSLEKKDIERLFGRK